VTNSRFLPAAASIVSFTLCIVPATASLAADLKLVGGSAVQPVMAELIPNFEKLAGHRVVTDLDAAVGAITARVQQGEPADVVIVSGAQIESLEKSGKLVPGSRKDLAKVGIGLFVRTGAPKPDISTVDAFKRALLTVKSIGYNDPAAGAPVGLYLIGLFERMGLSAELKSKTIVFTQRSERFGAVARGDVELGFNQVSEIIAVPTVEMVGPLPSDIQNYTLFAAGILSNSKTPNEARAFLDYISSAGVRHVWKEKGFDAP
jgi:molybdate transport system substrate-binding protein